MIDFDKLVALYKEVWTQLAYPILLTSDEPSKLAGNWAPGMIIHADTETVTQLTPPPDVVQSLEDVRSLIALAHKLVDKA